MALGVNSASNSNEYHEYFSLHRADTLTTFIYQMSQYLGTPGAKGLIWDIFQVLKVAVLQN